VPPEYIASGCQLFAVKKFGFFCLLIMFLNNSLMYVCRGFCKVASAGRGGSFDTVQKCGTRQNCTISNLCFLTHQSSSQLALSLRIS
jgi:hypothetical protein